MTPNFKSNRILVIDDNRSIHQDIKKILSSAGIDAQASARTALFGDPEGQPAADGFEIDSAYQGQEGLQCVEQACAGGRPYAMAFVDMRMPPGWDGVETITRLWKVDPDLQVVICTAYSDCTLGEMMARLGRTEHLLILKKPFDNVEVEQLAHALTEKWRLLQFSRAHTQELEGRVAERTRELLATTASLRMEMAERLKVEEALRQSQKMEAVGQFAAGVAHDFNNMLAVIRGHVELLLGTDSQRPPKDAASLREVDAAAARAASLTRQLLTLSHKQIIEPKTLDLNEVIGETSQLLQRLLGSSIALKIAADAGLPPVQADRVMIEQALINLAVNARDAMPGGGSIQIRTATVELTTEALRLHPLGRTGRFACFSVTDTGCGIAPEVVPRLFEPFFTTKETGKGTGMGLATSYGITKQHGGWIEVESAVGQGATFTIFLPAFAQAATAWIEPLSLETSDQSQGTILLVEDEAPLREVTRMVLQHYGYCVHAVSTGEEAREVWTEAHAEIDLLFTDVVLPGGMGGQELAQALTAEKPGLKVIYTSGYRGNLRERDGAKDEEFNFLPKPYLPIQLIKALRACLDAQGRLPEVAA